MDNRYAGLSEEQLQAYLETYLQLKSKYNRVMYSLFVAYVAQLTLYSFFFEAHVGRHLFPLVLVIAGLPWLVYFSITFIRLPPPITPGTFRRVLLFVIVWYVTNTVVLVSLGVAKLVPTTLPRAGTTALWVFAL